MATSRRGRARQSGGARQPAAKVRGSGKARRGGTTVTGPGRGWVIALVGIDGSGKTTQACRLASLLRAAGIPTSYWRNAGGRRWFGRVALWLGRRDGQHLLGLRGLLLAESALRWLAIARALLCARLRRRVAVMDRYAVCQYASIRAHLDGGAGAGGPAERLARLAYGIFPEPDVTFLLSVQPRDAYRRIEARGTDHESLRYLTAAQQAYLGLPESSSFVVVDAGGTTDEVARAISAHLPSLADPAFTRARTPGSKRR